MVPVVLCDTRHSVWNLLAGETTFFRGGRQEKTMLKAPLSAPARKTTSPTRATHPAGQRTQGLRRFIGKHQLNTIFAISTASLVWLQATAVLQTDLTKTA
jgi:hypothetical protein